MIDIHTFNVTYAVIQSVLDERYRQNLEHPDECSVLERVTSIGEEHGEVCEAALMYASPQVHDPSGEYDLPESHRRAALRREAVQLAAVTIRLIEELDQQGAE
jgi:hypothetical protein